MAVKYLETHGYRVLDRNYTTSVGEVDIFVTDEKTLIAVEVKSRLSLEYGEHVANALAVMRSACYGGKLRVGVRRYQS